MAKRAKRSVRRTRAPKKGLFFSNPYVASQIGAALGSVLVSSYVENPKLFSKAFDELLPLLVSFGRDFEREDILAVLEGKGRGKGLKLKDLAGLIKAGGHIRVPEVDEIKKRLSTVIRTYTARAQLQAAMARVGATTKVETATSPADAFAKAVAPEYERRAARKAARKRGSRR